MSGIAITLNSPSGGAHQILTTDFADADAAYAAMSTRGFLLVPNPVDPGQSASDGKSRLLSIADIHQIRSL